MKIDDCRIIEMPIIKEPRGNLTFIEGGKHIPFKVQRAYWIYDVPGGEVRGGHSYKELEEVIIALSGGFDVVIDDGSGAEQVFHLNRSYKGLYIPKLTWRQLRHFSTNSVAFILSSLPYSREDYLYEYDEFIRLRNG